ncbi:MAG: phosphoribosylamine--glycine ligase [Deltaproteobacteria bacterium]|nr:phosphoribosylamine--glycine ligase [Deltaproteobacteria bacterium]
MTIVLVGNGGREHALAWRLVRSPSCDRLVVTSPHPAWPTRAEHVPGDPVAVAHAAGAGLVVVGPEGPLADGLADRLAFAGIPCFGPTAAAARLESSKAFTKEILAAAGVATAAALVVDRNDLEKARARCARGNVVLKADGLAAGKGVVVCRTPEEALAALDEMHRFGAAADRLVLEDRLTGPEVSVFALCDGTRAVALPSAQDHKRLRDGDEGPNTGGMGAYAPCPLLPDEALEGVLDAVHRPVLAEMAKRCTPFRGVLYAGLMLTPDGIRVIEFNVRFGDPECQALMLLWQDDPVPWMLGAANGALPSGRPKFRGGSAVCVVLAAEGYPDAPTTGAEIPEGGPVEDGMLFVAGAKRERGRLVVSGGRVLGPTAWGPDIATARKRAYDAVDRWMFPGAQVRSDIASSDREAP